MVTKGRKRWIDRELAVGDKVVQLKEVKKVGGSWYLPLPKVWVDFSCKPDKDGKLFVIVEEVMVDRIIICGHKEP